MTELEQARDKICDYVDGIDDTPNFQHLLDNWERLVREDERRVTVGLCLRGFANYFRMEVADVIKFFPGEFESVLQDAAREP